MTSASDFTEIALALPGTTAAPHFDRTAFKVRRIYATLAADGLTANLKLKPDEQEFKVLLAPDAFAPVAGGWGRQGWTVVTFANLSREELAAALDVAWRHGAAGPSRKT
jgi:predicted DNA-binding protein (MmcQ/YjbR family)